MWPVETGLWFLERLLDAEYAGTMIAYLDPASGSMILQAVIGVVAGLLVFGRLWWGRIKRALGFDRHDSDTVDEHAP